MAVFLASDATLSTGAGKRDVMSIARYEDWPLEEFVEEPDEPLFEDEEFSLEDELPEPMWVEESWTALDTFDLNSDFEDLLPFPVLDYEWPTEHLNLRFPKKTLEPTPPVAIQDPQSSELVVVREDDSEQAGPDDFSVAVDPLLIEAAPPPYPLIARRRRWEGTVLCRIRVGADGTVLKVSVEESAGHSALDDAAIKAVREWRFRPGTRNGSASEYEVLHKVTFRLDS